MKRTFYSELLKWKAGGCNKPLLVTGARQVGKTYLIEEFCSAEFSCCKKVNLFDDSLFSQIFASNLTAEQKFKQLLLLVGDGVASPDGVLFVDEIQESEDFISFLKFLQENHPEVNVVCAGSLLGVKLKRLKKAFPVGRVQVKSMYPMCFDEFLEAVGMGGHIAQIVGHFHENTAMLPALHESLLLLYKHYCCIGGMPEAVSQYLALDGRIDHFDRSFFDDLYGAYLEDMGKYVRSGAESLKIERIFGSIPTQLNNSSARFQYSKAGKGARSLHYASALDWLLAAGLAHKAMAVSLPEKPLAYFADADVFKLFVHDVGMLTHRMGIAFGDLVLDSIGQAKGMVAESYVACEMVSKGRQLRYWRSANNAEVDFLLECQDGVIPVEVKSADNVRSKSLKAYCDKYKPAYAFRVSAKNFGMEGGIRSVPLYASFCLGGLK